MVVGGEWVSFCVRRAGGDEGCGIGTRGARGIDGLVPRPPGSSRMSAFAAVTPPSRRVHLDRALMRPAGALSLVLKP